MNATISRIPISIGMVLLFALAPYILIHANTPEVPLYGVFETQMQNEKRFAEVELNATFTAPSGRKVEFFGFYDGNGQGGSNGNIWKLRFMPDELGQWSYTYRWAERDRNGNEIVLATPGGSGSFEAVEEGALKGILRAYENNPRWLAYNGRDPIFLKSYKLGVHFLEPISFSAPHVYQPLIDNGYNHIEIGLLPIGGQDSLTQKWSNSPPVLNQPLYSNKDPLNTMNLAVWSILEENMIWLNDRNVGLQFFNGFDGKKNGQRWQDLNREKKDFFVRYVCARLAPFANVAGWNFTWETHGGGPEIGLMNRLIEYDPWNHLRSYHDQYPADNFFDRDEYTFAVIENDGYFDNPHRDKSSASHHHATLDAWQGKPIFMAEGQGLWRNCWGGDEDSIRRGAWAVTTAGGSFTWDWASPGCHEVYHTDEIFESQADEYIDILTDVMNNDLTFYKMNPHNELLRNLSGDANNANSEKNTTFCLAEPGKQYLIYKESGGNFDLSVTNGHFSAEWIDTKNGSRWPENNGSPIALNGTETFTSPPIDSDWVLILKAVDVTPPPTPAKMLAQILAPQKIFVRWTVSKDPESEVTHYNVYRNEDFLIERRATGYYDKDVQPGQTYLYEVTAVNRMGLESAKTPPSSVTLPQASLPGQREGQRKFRTIASFSGGEPNSIDIPSENGIVLIQVYSTGSRTSLVREIRSDGRSEISWDLLNQTGKKVVAGIYLLRMTYKDGRTDTQKVAVFK